MITLTILARRKDGWTRNNFLSYWRDDHAPLVASVGNFTRHVRSYIQLHINEVPELTQMFGGSQVYDGAAVLSFSDKEAMKAAFSEPDYLTIIRPDELKFVDVGRCIVLVGDQVSVI